MAPCVNRPVELVFLVDGSERLGQENFDHVRLFIENVAHSLQLASSPFDPTRARLALLQYGSHYHYQHTSFLTHDRTFFTGYLKSMRYLDASSDVGSAISYAVDFLFPNGRHNVVRQEAEVSFVFITEGYSGTKRLNETLPLMRKMQVVPIVVAMGNDIDNEVVLDLALRDRHAVFRGPDYKHLSNPDFLEHFIQWVC